MVVRFFMLQSHYSSTLDFSNEALEGAEKGYKRLAQALMNIKAQNPGGQPNAQSDRDKEFGELVDGCYKNMSDDFNTAKTLAVLFEMSARINDMKSGNLSIGEISEQAFMDFKSTYIMMMEDVLGLTEEQDHDHETLSGVVEVLIALRKKARADRNYSLSDRIRDDLKKVGVQLKDGKDGEMSWEVE